MIESEGAVEPHDAAAYFGREAQFAREALGMSQVALATELHYQQPYVSKVERGAQFASEEYAAGLDRLCRTPGVYVRLRARLSEHGHPGWFVPYVKLEASARAISEYSSAVVVGLLQTADYATAIFRAALPREDDTQTKGRVAARLRRQEILERKAPPLLWAILHESALRTVVGSRAIMRAQLEYLIHKSQGPHVAVQVLPFDSGAPASSIPFILLTQADGNNVVWSESRGQGHMNDSTAVVTYAQDTYERMRAQALSPDKSRDLISQVMEEHAR
ncbi:helix-turn-helix transcriptional regulator [Streptomyces sp. NPDC088341]|uniref:helix-turn-helix domain-containing protein n=1 Tax=Streptomyces sp. NPDC088341 TaxID=3154870 RepID=UPI0034316E9E